MRNANGGTEEGNYEWRLVNDLCPCLPSPLALLWRRWRGDRESQEPPLEMSVGGGATQYLCPLDKWPCPSWLLAQGGIGMAGSPSPLAAPPTVAPMLCVALRPWPAVIRSAKSNALGMSVCSL